MDDRAADAEINPYAPSAIPEPMVQRADRGIGVWRDGSDLVMHPQAELPRFCLLTGEKARYGYLVKIAWGYPLGFSQRTLGLYVPLSEKVHRLCLRRRWQATIGFLVALPPRPARRRSSKMTS
jgi:hypothetical protein